jgi:Zn-dependent peptidase ImmA (M78 family)
MAGADEFAAVPLRLDRMEVEEQGRFDPVRLADTIHRLLGRTDASVPVEAIAAGLDITEIRCERLTNLEGALVTTAERDIGAILVNAASSRPRQRFTIAHEIGHFLNLAHLPTDRDGFYCTSRDLATFASSSARTLLPHERQEIEANRFAIELLIPEDKLDGIRRRAPDLEQLGTGLRRLCDQAFRCKNLDIFQSSGRGNRMVSIGVSMSKNLIALKRIGNLLRNNRGTSFTPSL